MIVIMTKLIRGNETSYDALGPSEGLKTLQHNEKVLTSAALILSGLET